MNTNTLIPQSLTLFRVDLPADPKAGLPARHFWAGKLAAPFGTAEFTSLGLAAVAGALKSLKVSEGVASNGNAFVHLGLVEAEVEAVGEPKEFTRGDGTTGTAVPVRVLRLVRAEDKVTETLDGLVAAK